jgi:putative endonuclease
MTQARRALGARGEDAVAAWYEQRGYGIVDRNWRCREGELDLVARRGDVVVFCEVKTRSSSAFGAPVEAVTWRKQQRLRQLARLWLMARGGVPPAGMRFDVASVLAGRIEIVEDAF